MCRTHRRSAVRSSRLRQRGIVNDLARLLDLVEIDGFDLSGLAVRRKLRNGPGGGFPFAVLNSA